MTTRMCVLIVASLCLVTPRLVRSQISGEELYAERDGGRTDGHGHAVRIGQSVDCDAGDTVSSGLAKLHPGETLVVHGTCIENVEIPDSISEITLDGQGTGAIRSPDPLRDVVRVYADQVTIQGLTLSGGRDGINLRGAQGAIVQNNVLEGNLNSGLNVHRLSWATAKGNVMRDNGAFGIMVYEGSIARIGFTETGAAAPSPNVIERNGGYGVWVARASHADIGGNVIRDNGMHGVQVERGSHAELRANDIAGNGGSAVSVVFGSGANLAGGLPTDNWRIRRNESSAPNGSTAILCSTGGFTAGAIGGLAGQDGARSISAGCVDTTQ